MTWPSNFQAGAPTSSSKFGSTPESEVTKGLGWYKKLVGISQHTMIGSSEELRDEEKH